MIENTIGCITHYNQQHLQIRSDYEQICEFDRSLFVDKSKRKEEPNVGCMAMILRVMETLTDARYRHYAYPQKQSSQGQPEEIPLDLSNEAIQKMTHSFFGATTIRNSLTMLIQKGFLKRVQNNRSRYPSYVFCTSEVQQALIQVALLSGLPETPSPVNEAYLSDSTRATDFAKAPTDFAKAPTDFERVPTDFAKALTDFERVPTDFADNNIVSNRVSNISDKKMEVAESSVAFAIPITEDSISVTTPVEPPQTTPRPAKQPPESSLVQISPEGEMVFQRWCAVFGNSPLSRTAAIVETCEKLAPFHLTEDDFRSIINYMRENDHKGYYKKRGIKLWDILPEYPGWASIHRLVIAVPAPQISSRKNLSDIVREARKKYA